MIGKDFDFPKPSKVCSDSALVSEPVPLPGTDLNQCKGCPYPSHGFICNNAKGECLRTEIKKINERKRGGKNAIKGGVKQPGTS